MHDLIPEICDIIFAFCTYAECDMERYSVGYCQTNSLVVLTRVCRRWRAMVINNPSLWTRIHVCPVTFDTFRACLWLERSANMPLQVTICQTFNGVDSDSISNTRMPLMHQFIPYFDRIQTFKARLGRRILPVIFPPFELIDMPLLEEMHLLTDEKPYYDMTLGVFLAPKLQTLVVRDITPFVDALACVLPNVQTLTVKECPSWKSPQTFHKMLASCVRLRTCSIAFPSNGWYVTFAPMAFPELESLSLEWPLEFSLFGIFGSLRAPKLRSLRISDRARERPLPSFITSFLRHLIQSTTGLTSLAVKGCNLSSQDDALRVLQECKALQTLEIVNCHRADHFLIPLTPTNPHDIATWVCRSLTYVAITGLEDTDVRPLVNFARSRSDRRSMILEQGGRYLEELALDVNIYNLTRQARILMLSGLLGIYKFLNIVGPFGELFNSQVSIGPFGYVG
ncbi:hypothetical protein BDZ97DRAFT_1812778 [Flammula alnicola]|nr:hypothetical protein BDZ97DRAFT_1812778 [Flammula alnicola]